MVVYISSVIQPLQVTLICAPLKNNKYSLEMPIFLPSSVSSFDRETKIQETLTCKKLITVFDCMSVDCLIL